ncbi:hypothetical protein KR222_001442, partial [Zaprionus bogoriensis]
EAIEEKVEDLIARLDTTTTTTDNTEESKELAKTVSLCIMMEGRALQITDSSEDGAMFSEPKKKPAPQRIFEPEEIREAFTIFKSCDQNNDNMIELHELKLALERLSVPQTHLVAKGVMAEIAGQNVSQLNFCQFLLVYAVILQQRDYAADLQTNSSGHLDDATESVNVSEVGVSGAKQFFEAKIAKQ